MSTEIEKLVAKTTNREGLAHLFDRLADRLDELIAERRRETAEEEQKETEEVGEDG